MIQSLSVKGGSLASGKASRCKITASLTKKTSFFLDIAPWVSRTNKATRKKPSLLESKASRIAVSEKTFQKTR